MNVRTRTYNLGLISRKISLLTWWIFLPSPILQISSRSKSTQKRPSSVPTTIRSLSMRQADNAWLFLIMLTVLSRTSRHLFFKKENVNFTIFFFLAKLSFYLKTILDGSWFFFRIRCSSFNATTHLVFSLSVSANIKHWCRTPGGSIRLVVTRKIHGTSFLLAWMTSLSRTVLTSNSGSRMSNTWLTATPKRRYRQVRNWFCFVHACQYFTFMFKNWYLAFQNCVIRCIAYLLQDLCILKTKIFRSVS